MKIERETYDGVAVLTITGTMLIGEGDELLREEIQRCLDDGVRQVLLDLEEVPYVDSAGLSEIVRSFTRMSRSDGTVGLLNPSKRIRDLLTITRMRSVFPTFTYKEDAIKALQKRIRKKRR